MGWDYEDAEAAYWEADNSTLRQTLGTFEANTRAMIRKNARKRENMTKKAADLNLSAFSKSDLHIVIAKAQEELDRRDRVPIEPIKFVSFEFQFEGTGRVYNYVAIKADGVWYVTGEESGAPQGSTWEHLFEWFDVRGKILSMVELTATAAIRLR